MLARDGPSTWPTERSCARAVAAESGVIGDRAATLCCVPTEVIDGVPGRDPGSAWPPGHRRWRPDRYAFGGLVIAVLFVWLTPTLLPRGPIFQGLVTGVSAAIGYAVGFLGSKLVRYLVRREAPARVKTIVRRVASAIGLVGTTGMLVWFGNWQAQLRELMSAAPFCGGATS